MAHTIKLKKYSNVIEEYVANGAITPGHLVALGSAGTVAVHAVKGGPVFPMFALEDELQGNGIDTAYTTATPVQVWIPGRGDVVNAWLTGATVAAGDKLMSNGDGTLCKYASALAAATLLTYRSTTHGINFTARVPGSAGNSIVVTVTQGATLAVTVTGTTVAVVCNITGSETFADIIGIIQTSAAASALVICEAVGTPSTVAVALTAGNGALSGGVDMGPLAIVAEAMAATVPSGAVVRVRARIA